MTDPTASEVSVGAAGEVVEADVQAQLETFDRATAKNERIDDLQIATTLVDDFVSGTSQTGKIGKLGWTSDVTNDGQVTRGTGYSEPGVMVLDTGANGAAMLRLGTGTLAGSPLFVCDMRVKLVDLNQPGEAQATCCIGLYNGVAGQQPGTGFFFRYAGLGHWEAVCVYAGAASPPAVLDRVAVDNEFHRFRITCDGGEWGSGIVRFYIDPPAQPQVSTPDATITNEPPPGNRVYLPLASVRYAPALSITTTGGGTNKRIAIDYFALRREVAR
jgi:hypothetical protein